MVGQVVPDSRGNGSLPIQGSSGPFCCHFLSWESCSTLVRCSWWPRAPPLWAQPVRIQLLQLSQSVCVVHLAQDIWGAEVLVNSGVLRGSQYSFSCPWTWFQADFFMSPVVLAHTSCVHGAGGLLPSLQGWAANLMLTELGDVKGKFILTLTKTVMKTQGRFLQEGFVIEKRSGAVPPVA